MHVQPVAPRARRAFPAPACGRTPRRPQACALHSLTCAGPQGARAGWRHPSRRPCPARRFGRWAPKVQRGPRRHPPYSLKGSVPEAPAYVSVRLCMDLGSGGGATNHALPQGVARSRGLVVQGSCWRACFARVVAGAHALRTRLPAVRARVKTAHTRRIESSTGRSLPRRPPVARVQQWTCG